MSAAVTSPPPRAMSFTILRLIRRHYRVGIAYVIMLVLYYINAELNERMFTRPVITSTFNQSMTLVFAGMAQISVVLTGGIDLSVGSMNGLPRHGERTATYNSRCWNEAAVSCPASRPLSFTQRVPLLGASASGSSETMCSMPCCSRNIRASIGLSSPTRRGGTMQPWPHCR